MWRRWAKRAPDTITSLATNWKQVPGVLKGTQEAQLNSAGADLFENCRCACAGTKRHCLSLLLGDCAEN